MSVIGKLKILTPRIIGPVVSVLIDPFFHCLVAVYWKWGNEQQDARQAYIYLFEDAVEKPIYTVTQLAEFCR